LILRIAQLCPSVRRGGVSYPKPQHGPLEALSLRRRLAAGAEQAPDPILAAIEAHKAAHAKLVSWVDRHCKLENELPEERRRSSITASDEEIVETDDRRWIEAERQVGLTGDAEVEAAYALIETIPTTRFGMLALLEHAIIHDTDGHAWPDEWRNGLLETLSHVLPTLWQEGRV